jgi:Na+-transporting methylmalonyl-CoA/oxaloacetate decarboxylase gamma subunit
MMTTMSAGMTVAMVLVCLIILVFVVLGIAAFIKYSAPSRTGRASTSG